MGNGHSRSRHPGDSDGNIGRRPVGKRTSINFLHKLDSRTMNTRPVSLTAQNTGADTEALIQTVPQPLQSHPPDSPAPSPSSTTTVLRAEDFFSNQQPATTKESLSDQISIKSSEDSLSNSSSSPCASPQQVVSEIGSHSQDTAREGTSCTNHTPRSSEYSALYLPSESSSDCSSDAGDGSGPDTPLAHPREAQLPVLRIPTPLAHDSPALYAFEEMMEVEYTNVFRLPKQRATTAPGLFHQARERLKASEFHTRPPGPVEKQPGLQVVVVVDAPPCEVYIPAASKYSPAELFRRAHLRCQRLSMSQSSDACPRTIRLHRRPYPDNLIRDESSNSSAGVALARPLAHSQKDCFIHHKHWQGIASIHPLECSICLGKATRSEAYMCTHCALLVCADCNHAHDHEAMMTRYADGSKTTEAKKAALHRQSA